MPTLPSPPDHAPESHAKKRDAASDVFAACDTFARRHIGISQAAQASMLERLGLKSLDALCAQTVPNDIALGRALILEGLPAPEGESATLERLREMASHNIVLRSYIGMGYTPCITPPVIARNIFENPGWYTAYTPYQAEIAQGRLEALLNFQTMVADLTGLGFANASLLDEATAAAEAMAMTRALAPDKRAFFVSASCHPQTQAVLQTRADSLGFELIVGDIDEIAFDTQQLFGVLVQYPDTSGRINDYEALCLAAHQHGAYVVCACDLLALTLLRPPGEFGADIAVGSAQRFGVPLGFGGPHAAFLATHPSFKRQMPGRVIGVSRDARGKPALRMALQTREQHIRREKATSNICTAQALLAIMASMYGVYHGPDGLGAIARRVHEMSCHLAAALEHMGYTIVHKAFFDTLLIALPQADAESLHTLSVARGINLRQLDAQKVGVTLDEAVTPNELHALLALFKAHLKQQPAPNGAQEHDGAERFAWDNALRRTSNFMQHPVFHSYHTEHEMLRYMRRLESRDLSLAHAMIPLGSCTMKLNATSEMLPVSWPQFAQMHPFAPAAQTQGYARLTSELQRWLCEITGFAGVSLQPNAGAQGEYAGLMVIRAYHRAHSAKLRNVCLIPVSAHGTNPASAALAGMRVVVVACDAKGNVNVDDLEAKARLHENELAALMVTYPSTHGVFESSIRRMCDIVHKHGGQVYLDGANMNAQVGLCRPGDYGADVCHLNLHKTFCIPHGGGGPGVGPIGVAEHLVAFLPRHPMHADTGSGAVGAVSAAPFGSASILPISWMYIAMMGPRGLRFATQIALLSANYMAERLGGDYAVLYRGDYKRTGHEFILDMRPFKISAGIEAEDVAKRLMDYGFHAPTMSFPVAGTLMIEPTESESLRELDRLCDALIAIRQEIKAIEEGQADKQDNLLKGAPHTADMVCADTWSHPYSRTAAAYPAPWLLEHKFWPAVARIDNAYGDRNLVCTCPPISAYED